MTHDPNVEAELRRLEAAEREARRLAPLAADLSAPAPKPTGPTPEQLGEAEREARAFLRMLRRRRAAGRVQHGQKLAIPSARAKFPTRRSA
jgi:hypothetical protein